MEVRDRARLALAIAALLGASPALAQNDANSAAEPRQREERSGFPWGVLGLIGLAGLLSLRSSDGDIHVDARRNR